jgi:hypothetical protein
MKRLILGLVIGMLIGSAATAAAASDTVTATITKLRFVINGEERDVQTEQLVVMGTTYLPVREVANMLGYDVIYRSDSKTVEFNTANDSTKKGASIVTETIIDTAWISLRDLAEQHNLEVRQITIDGKTYGVFRDGGIVLSIYYDGKTSTVTTSTPEGDTVRAEIQNGSTMLSLEDLEAAGIIQ